MRVLCLFWYGMLTENIRILLAEAGNMNILTINYQVTPDNFHTLMNKIMCQIKMLLVSHIILNCKIIHTTPFRHVQVTLSWLFLMTTTKCMLSNSLLSYLIYTETHTNACHKNSSSNSKNTLHSLLEVTMTDTVTRGRFLPPYLLRSSKPYADCHH